MKHKATAILTVILLASCSTTIRDPQTGQKVFQTYADAANITFTAGAISFHADQLIHSVHTEKALRGTSGIIQSTGVATGEVVAGSIMRKAVR